MTRRTIRIIGKPLAAVVLAGSAFAVSSSFARPAASAAQLAPAAQNLAQAGRSARGVAPVDLTGYWVSIVTEDWRWRMLTPPPKDFESVPLNPEGRKVLDSWDLAKDNASGNQCRAFGVGGIVRQPGRMHITWQDDTTLKVEFDAGTQTRLLHFDRSQPAGEKTWQGHSLAQWVGAVGGRGGRRGEAVSTDLAPGGGGVGLRGGPAIRRGGLPTGTIKVTTTNFREGYLRKNGVPYSENAAITEFFQRLPQIPGSDVLMVVTTTVDDPKYLTQPFYTSTNFKQERDGSKWDPSPCQTDPPTRGTLK